MLIRPAVSADGDALWRMLEPVIRAGETYALPLDMERRAALAYWCGKDRMTFIAELDGTPVGTYFLRRNPVGADVANCGYVTALGASGRGIGRLMCVHSIEQARRSGFNAMQFNFVVASNARAIRLWQSMEFVTVGRLYGAFTHPRLGPTDALVMQREL